MNVSYEIKKNLKAIQEKINLSNLQKRHITLVGASKSQSIEKMIVAHADGLHDFGENYVQEAQTKMEILKSKITRQSFCFHFIGKIQSKKSKQIAHLFDRIHSLDSLKTASLMNDELKKINKVLPALIEINIAEQPQRGGITPSQLENFIKDLANCKNLAIDGLMCIASNESIDIYRQQFKKMKQLLESTNALNLSETKLSHLSMGMSNDFEAAIQEGATMIRIGSKLFGERMAIEN